MRKLILIISIFVLLQSVSGQNPLETKLTISFQAGTAAAALDALESVCECRFSYNPALIPARISPHEFTNTELQKILKVILEGDYQPKSRGSYIILNAPVRPVAKTSHELKGEIKDASTGEKLTNVTIYDVSTLTATLSDSEGKYDLITDSESEEVVVAISKKNYQDTVIRVSEFLNPEFTLTLRPLTKPNSDIQKESTGVFKKVIGKVFEEHEKNVQLYEERFFQLGFIPGFGTNGVLGGKVTNKFSINLIAGNANGVKGTELSGVISRNKTDVIGFQASGVASIVGENVRGAQFSGVSNTILGGVYGMQAAGVINTSRDMKGFQTAGVQNTSVGQVTGLQLAGVVNYSGQMKGTQIAGVWNHNSGLTQGLQLSGVFNYTKTLRGVQIGVINIANKVEKGFAFGLFNFVKEGFHKFDVGTNDIADFNASFKSGVPGLYSILNAGISLGDNGLWTYGIGMGSQVIQGNKLTLDLATSYNTVNPIGKHLVNTPYNTQFDVLLGFNITEGLAVNAGPVLHWLRYPQEPNDPSDFLKPVAQKPIFHKGKADPRNTSILWIGYQANIRF